MRILIADDDPVSRRVLERALVRLGHEVMPVTDGTAALQGLLGADAPRLAILDWMMPGTDGLAVCREVRRRSETYVYIIVLTAKDGREDMVAALDAEVDDFLTKPLDVVELRARLRSGQRVIGLQERLLKTQEALRLQATHDHLTCLWNRRMILEELGGELSRAARDSRPMAIAIGDLDHFKTINDTHGHATGDAVLQVAAARLLSVLRSYDAVGRLGGEEFLLVLPGCQEAEALEVAERARAAVASSPMASPAGPLSVSMSLGVACYRPGSPAEAVALVERADAALYRAKAGGRNQVSV